VLASRRVTSASAPTGRLAVTSAVRFAAPGEQSAFLRVLDLERGQVVFTTPVPESSRRRDDPNPRGGARGAKGISVHGERIAVANSESVFCFDRCWRPLATIQHPLLGGVHDLLAEDDGVWVACANCDALLRFDWTGGLLETWSPREDAELLRALGVRGLPRFDPGLDYRDPRVMHTGLFNGVHLNGVARARDGSLLVSLGRILGRREIVRRRVRGAGGRVAHRLGVGRSGVVGGRREPVSRIPGSASAIVRLAGERPPRRAEVLQRVDGIELPNHNVAHDGDLVVFNDSNGNRLVAYDLRERAEACSVAIPGNPGFARGLARLPDGLWLVGSQAPFAVYACDLAAGRVVAAYPLQGLEHETVYALSLLPDTVADPPPSGATSLWGPLGSAR